jgi:hypothetical protein
MESKLTADQKIIFGWDKYKESGECYRIRATVRYDDSCRNGHNTFSITGEIQRGTKMYNGEYIWREDSFGCIHEAIAKHFPELAPLIKWHLTSSDGPMHYIANTLYNASERDHWGLLKGEKRQLRNGKTGQPVWHLVIRDENGNEVSERSLGWVDSDECPTSRFTVQWEPRYIIGEGKERNLDHARSSAVWPEATDEELTAPNLKEHLEARHPALMAEFRAAVESLGFTF